MELSEGFAVGIETFVAGEEVKIYEKKAAGDCPVLRHFHWNHLVPLQNPGKSGIGRNTGIPFCVQIGRGTEFQAGRKIRRYRTVLQQGEWFDRSGRQKQ